MTQSNGDKKIDVDIFVAVNNGSNNFTICGLSQDEEHELVWLSDYQRLQAENETLSGINKHLYEQLTKSTPTEIAKVLQQEVDKATAALAAEKRKVEDLEDAAFQLRKAQKAYMADRGNNELGKIVAIQAEVLDQVLSKLGTDGIK